MPNSEQLAAVSNNTVEAPRWIRATHHYGFRNGQWAKLVNVVPARERDCWLVEFPDGVTDLWVVADASDYYEFSYAEEMPESEDA